MLATTSTATTTMAPTAAEAVAPAPARTIRRGTLAVITASASVPAAAETTLAVPAVKASRTGTLAQQQQQQSEAPAQATTLAPAPAPARATRRGTLLRTQETDASDAAPQPRAGNRRGSVLKTTAPAETVQGTTRKGTRRGTMSRQQQQTQQPSSVADAAPAGLARAVSAVRRVTAAAGAEKEATSSSSSSGAQTQGKVATPAPALDLNMTVEQFLTQQCELYIELLHQETETYAHVVRVRADVGAFAVTHGARFCEPRQENVQVLPALSRCCRSKKESCDILIQGDRATCCILYIHVLTRTHAPSFPLPLPQCHCAVQGCRTTAARTGAGGGGKRLTQRLARPWRWWALIHIAGRSLVPWRI